MSLDFALPTEVAELRAEGRVETGDEPLTLERCGFLETRYPLAMESRFNSSDPRLDAVIPFGPLPAPVIHKVVQKFVLQMEAQLADRGVTFEAVDAELLPTVGQGVGEQHGAAVTMRETADKRHGHCRVPEKWRHDPRRTRRLGHLVGQDDDDLATF